MGGTQNQHFLTELYIQEEKAFIYLNSQRTYKKQFIIA